MSIIQSIFLGALQGLTEYLPVSSSGHLVLFQKIFSLDDQMLFFDVMLHFATVIPVLIIFRKDILEIFKNPLKSKLLGYIILGTIPAALFGYVFKDFFEKIFFTGASLGVGFIFTALILLFVESKKSGARLSGQLKVIDSVIIGIAQAIAIFPAVSRSGLTIAAGLFRGIDRKFAAKFSFLLAVPAVIGASLLEAREISFENLESGFYISVFFGMVAAAITGYVAIRWMLSILEKKTLKPFAWYVGILGVVILILQISGKW